MAERRQAQIRGEHPTGAPGQSDQTPDNTNNGAANGTGDASNGSADQGQTMSPPPGITGDGTGNGPEQAGGAGGGETADNGSSTPPPANGGTDNSTGDGTAGDGTQAADNSVTDAAGGLGDTTGGIVQTGDGLIHDVVQAVDNVVHDATDTGGGLLGNGTDAGNGLLGDVTGTVDGIVTGAVNTVDGLLHDVIGALDGLTGNGTTGLGLVDSVVDTGNGLINDVTHAVDNLAGTGIGSGLLGDVVQTVDNTVTDVTHAAGLDGGANGLLGDLTGTVGGIGDATGNGGLIADAINAANGGFTGVIDTGTGPNGSNPSILASLTDDGGVGHLVNDIVNPTLADADGLGLTDGSNPILSASALPDGNGIVDNGVNATVNDPSSTSPLIDLDAISNGQNGSSNLVNASALNLGDDTSILANVFSADGASPADITGNIIDVGPAGHTLADANVLTSPDQFQFASLGGAGADGLVGALTDGLNVTTSAADLPTVTLPTLGDAQPIIDLDLNGNTGGEHSLLDTQHPLGIV